MGEFCWLIDDKGKALKQISLALFFFLFGVVTSHFFIDFHSAADMLLDWSQWLKYLLLILFFMAIILYWNNKLRRINAELDGANKKLADLSETDGLTQLKNRHFMTLHLPRLTDLANRSHTSIAVAMLDIDDFKQINDSYGHAVGDDCLIHFSQLIKTVFKRDSDCLIRFGGEEFMVVCFGINQTQFARLLESLRSGVEALAVPVPKGLHGITIYSDEPAQFTISCGYTFCPAAPHNNMKALLQLADQHLYQAKHNGRNRIVGFELENNRIHERVIA